ncbi:hypothetical protein N7490_001837 [Penicillium lividum]|nr:hypothetical protein N7490_001837 [Penicillium lividum]
MPRPLLPSSAKAFAPRAQPYIVLKPKYSEWLAKVIKQAKSANHNIRRRKNSSGQVILLSIILAPDTAIWTLYVTDLFQAYYKARQVDVTSHTSPAETRYIQAHVVHVDTISRDEIGFKLTPDTIEGLIKFYDNHISCHMSSSIGNGPQKVMAPHHKDSKEGFVQRVNEFVFCTHVSALNSLQSDGTGTLIGIHAIAAREAINSLLVSGIASQQEDGLWQQEGRFSQASLLPTQERGQIDSFNSHSSFDPWSIEEALPDMTIPYRPLAHTVYTDQSSSLGAVWGTHPLLSRDEQQFPPPYARFSSRSSLLQWPSSISGETGGMEEFDESGRCFMSG